MGQKISRWNDPQEVEAIKIVKEIPAYMEEQRIQIKKTPVGRYARLKKPI